MLPRTAVIWQVYRCMLICVFPQPGPVMAIRPDISEDQMPDFIAPFWGCSELWEATQPPYTWVQAFSTVQLSVHVYLGQIPLFIAFTNMKTSYVPCLFRNPSIWFCFRSPTERFLLSRLQNIRLPFIKGWFSTIRVHGVWTNVCS